RRHMARFGCLGEQARGFRRILLRNAPFEQLMAQPIHGVWLIVGGRLFEETQAFGDIAWGSAPIEQGKSERRLSVSATGGGAFAVPLHRRCLVPGQASCADCVEPAEAVP